MSEVEVIDKRKKVFQPEDHHWLALEAFAVSGGQTRDAQRASGLSSTALLALMRRPWWQEELEAVGFVPVTQEMLGEAIAKEAGTKALDRLTTGGFLPTGEIVALGRLGMEMQKSVGDGPTQVNIGHIHQLDLRGLDARQLAILVSGNPEG